MTRSAPSRNTEDTIGIRDFKWRKGLTAFAMKYFDAVKI